MALLGALLASFAVPAQQKQSAQTRISCPMLDPHPVKMVQPIYPPSAKQTHISGKVTLRCIIGRDGSVKEIQVKKGHPLLIRAATDAVSQWKYKPLILKGQAVETDTVIDIVFELLPEKKQPESAH